MAWIERPRPKRLYMEVRFTLEDEHGVRSRAPTRWAFNISIDGWVFRESKENSMQAALEICGEQLRGSAQEISGRLLREEVDGE